MAVTGTKTVRDIVTQSLRKAGMTGFSEAAAPEDAAVALEELNDMLKHWQNEGFNLWTKTSGTLTLTTSAEHTLSPVRPLRILSARYSDGTTEIPMLPLTRDEYDELPNKATTGIPTQFHYDRQREDARFYVWPVLATAAGETVEYTYERELEDIASLNDTIDVPGEMWDTVKFNLAVRLRDSAGMEPKPLMVQQAVGSYQKAMAADREGSVFFCAEGYED